MYVQFEILLIRSYKIQHRKFTGFWKTTVKSANIYDLDPLSVKWYCNHGRDSEGILYHLHCNTLGNTLQC